MSHQVCVTILIIMIKSLSQKEQFWRWIELFQNKIVWKSRVYSKRVYSRLQFKPKNLEHVKFSNWTAWSNGQANW